MKRRQTDYLESGWVIDEYCRGNGIVRHSFRVSFCLPVFSMDKAGGSVSNFTETIENAGEISK